MKIKVFDKRVNNGNYYEFNSIEEFHKYQLQVWACRHKLVLLGTTDDTLVFERKEN